MNNNSNNNDNNIDDILDILQKRKQQDIKNNNFSDDAPTRIDTQAVKPESVPEKKAPENQASLFDGDVKINDGPVTNKADISKPSNTNMQKDPSDATSDSVKEVKPENISGIVISSIPASVDKTASSANPEKPASPVSKPVQSRFKTGFPSRKAAAGSVGKTRRQCYTSAGGTKTTAGTGIKACIPTRNPVAKTKG